MKVFHVDRYVQLEEKWQWFHVALHQNATPQSEEQTWGKTEVGRQEGRKVKGKQNWHNQWSLGRYWSVVYETELSVDRKGNSLDDKKLVSLRPTIDHLQGYLFCHCVRSHYVAFRFPLSKPPVPTLERHTLWEAAEEDEDEDDSKWNPLAVLSVSIRSSMQNI